MEYKIRGKNDITKIRECICQNRGVEDYYTYTHLTDDVLLNYDLLDNISDAVQIFIRHINNKSNISILVDCDVDGQCSAAMMYIYIKSIDPDIKITYILHSGKQHGLSEDIHIPEDTQLLIIPDAGTNDTEQCKSLAEKNIDIIILDHHQKEVENPYACIINNQTSDRYTNKELCGAGIVYKFLQALDDSLWNDKADSFFDLVALANISDIMDIRSFETKRLIDKGLSAVVSLLFEEFINAQNSSMHGKINAHNVAFCITSLINAMCRVGNMEEKDLMFRAFIEREEIFQHKKRGEPEPVEETIYQRAVRLCKNAKARQDKQVNTLLPDYLKKYRNSNNAVLFVKGDNIPRVFSGLMAMKIADKCKKPCLVLRANNESEKTVYRGSARNFDNSYIVSLKQFLTDTELFNWCQGHNGAFGFEIDTENIKPAIEKINTLCADIDKAISVDFEIDYEDFDVGVISDVVSLEDCYGTGFKEPIFVIKSIPLYRNQGSTMGGNNDTWKFIDNDIAIIKFKNPSDDPVLNFLDSFSDVMYINALCTVGVSEYKGIITPQIVVSEYEVIENNE